MFSASFSMYHGCGYYCTPEWAMSNSQVGANWLEAPCSDQNRRQVINNFCSYTQLPARPKQTNPFKISHSQENFGCTQNATCDQYQSSYNNFDKKSSTLANLQAELIREIKAKAQSRATMCFTQQSTELHMRSQFSYAPTQRIRAMESIVDTNAQDLARNCKNAITQVEPVFAPAFAPAFAPVPAPVPALAPATAPVIRQCAGKDIIDNIEQDPCSPSLEQESTVGYKKLLGGTAQIPQLLMELMSVELQWQNFKEQEMKLELKFDINVPLEEVAQAKLEYLANWCKNLPHFEEILPEDRIRLFLNNWCHLLVLSCCFRSMDLPRRVYISDKKHMTLSQARRMGLDTCMGLLFYYKDRLKDLGVDRYEYVAMKAITLLQEDAANLVDPVKVQSCQDKILKALQSYTLTNYPENPFKFGKLLQNINELKRIYKNCNEKLLVDAVDGGQFNSFVELLVGIPNKAATNKYKRFAYKRKHYRSMRSKSSLRHSSDDK